jgi:hypothetical protein
MKKLCLYFVHKKFPCRNNDSKMVAVNVQGCAKQRSEEKRRPAPVCYRCGEEGHFARGCSSRGEVVLLIKSALCMSMLLDMFLYLRGS